MSVVVIKNGILDTIQDEGRYGYQHLGINPGGAMDLVAATIANFLVGNASSAAIIELHFPASVFQFKEDCLIALAGADFGATINDVSIPLNTSVLIRKNATLKFTGYKKGARCYLAVSGGWIVDAWLKSHSTNLKIGIGGFGGKALQKGDLLSFNNHLSFRNISHADAPVLIANVSLDLTIFNYDKQTVRCIAGGEFEWLTQQGKLNLLNASFTVTNQSDRMGFHLKGPTLETSIKEELLSTAVTRGTIQLLPTGQLILLMADHQTTGGYPKVAQVISADFYKLAQMRPNDSFSFTLVDHQTAEEEYILQQEYLRAIGQDVYKQLSTFEKEINKNST